MPRTHDGITAPLPIRPTAVLVGIGIGIGGIAALLGGWACTGAFAVTVAGFVLLDQRGTRRIRVLHSKLLVEDERLLTNLLIGPRRSRVEWSKVRGVRVDGGRLVADTEGAPFVTAEGAPAEDLDALCAAAHAAWQESAKRAR